jgi:hypothetical protein
MTPILYSVLIPVFAGIFTALLVSLDIDESPVEDVAGPAIVLGLIWPFTLLLLSILCVGFLSYKITTFFIKLITGPE